MNKRIEKLAKLYIEIFFPKWYQTIKKTKIIYKLNIKSCNIAQAELDDNQIIIYETKDKIDLFKTFLHEFAHLITYKLYKDGTHSYKWRKILNQLRNPFYKIWHGKLNPRF